MAVASVFDELQEKLQLLEKYAAIGIVGRKHGRGTISFEEAQADIDLALSTATDLLGLPLRHLTDAVHDRLADHTAEVVSKLEEEIDDSRPDRGCIIDLTSILRRVS